MSNDQGTRHAMFKRRSSLRHLLHRDQLLGSLTLAKQPCLRVSAIAGLQAAVVTAILLPLVLISPWPEMIGFASLGALVALFGRFAPVGRRNRILLFCALCQISAVLLMSGAVWLGLPVSAQLGLLALASGGFYYVTMRGQFGPPGALIFIFAASAGMMPVDGYEVVLTRGLATAIGAGLALALCAASEFLRHPWLSVTTPPSNASASHKTILLAAVPMVLGAGIAAGVSQALAAPHPAWAAMGAVAVLQGQHLHIRLHRSLQRMIGTVLGALLAWLVLLSQPSPWLIIAVIIILQVLTELVIGANYGLGQIFVTPMALMMVHLAAMDSTGPELAGQRVYVTILGALIGIVLAVLISTLDERRHLAQIADSHRSKP